MVSGVPMRDMQIAMRRVDPRATGLYGMAKNNKDRHAGHRVASFLAGMTGLQPGGCGHLPRLGSVGRTRALLDGGWQPYGSTLDGLRTRVLADPTCASSVQERRDQHDKDVVGVVGE